MHKCSELIVRSTVPAAIVCFFIATVAGCADQGGSISTGASSVVEGEETAGVDPVVPEAAPEVVPPSVFSTVPSVGANHIDLSGNIQVQFNKSLLLASVDSTQFTLHQQDKLIPANVSFDGTTAILDPVEELTASTHFKATLHSGIVDNDGNALEQYNWDFFTEGNGWRSEQNIAQTSGLQHYPQVSVDSEGNAMAVWYFDDGNGDSIYSNRYSVDTGWGTVERVDSGLGDAIYPQVGVDAHGNALAIWQKQQGYMHIYANRFIAGEGWGTPELIETDSRYARSAQLSVNADGSGFAVWSLNEGTSSSIYANQYSTETGWGAAQLVESSSQNAGSPQIGIDNEGNALAVWVQSDGTSDSIYANRYSKDTNWGAAELIESSAKRASNLQVAYDANGNARAIWKQTEGGGVYSLHENVYTSGSGWGTASSITSGLEYGSIPRIGINANGDALVAWSKSDGVAPSIYAARYSDESGWIAPELLESGSGNAYDANVGIDTAGNAQVIWHQSDGGIYDIYTTRYASASDAWNTPEKIEQSSGYVSYQKIQLNSNGQAIVLWRQDGSLQAAHFDSRVVSPE